MENQDFKYVMQDVSRVYIGAKFTYQEMLDRDDIPFKFKAILSHYMLKEVSADTTPENHVFYLSGDSLSYMVYRQLGVQFKMNVWQPEKGHYKSLSFTVSELYDRPEVLAQKDTIVVEELMIPKVKIMMFTV
ncbi:MAG: hypothetical protein ACI4SZ_03450 [Lachnospiraceae bacterium]